MTLSPTEQNNPNTNNIDEVSTLDAIRLINNEDNHVASAVEKTLGEVAQVIDSIVDRIVSKKGRLFYIGTGTSGRLGVLDASEIPPTFGVPAELIQGVIAGGYEALYKAVEASEDDAEAGRVDLMNRELTGNDAVIGIAASGRTPYTIGAVKFAKSIGCFTACIACSPEAAITRAVDIAIVADVGPEAITGSTRMKSGTAQKMILNMISTVTMIRLGYVKGNRMTNLNPKNEKLKERAKRILMEETGLTKKDASSLLESAKNDLKIALVMHETGVSAQDAEKALDETGSVVKKAIVIIRATF